MVISFELFKGNNTMSFFYRSHLYKANPSPFGNERLSEAYWAREAWPLLKDLLSDVDGITMVDGEKHGHESTKRNGQNRRLDQEGQNPRKPGGNKLDLAARDLVNQRDWLVGEAKKEWDELGTNFLREVGVKLFKHLHLVAEHRLQENGSMAFKNKSKFFAFFSGGKRSMIQMEKTDGRLVALNFTDFFLLQMNHRSWVQGD